MRTVALFFAVIVTLFVAADPAHAEQNGVLLKPDFDNPALIDRTKSELGGVSYHVVCPRVPQSTDGITLAQLTLARRVEVTIGTNSDSYRDPSLVATLLVEARTRALVDCPMTYADADGQIYTARNGGPITVYRGSVAPDNLLLETRAFNMDGFDETWDRGAAREAQRAAVEAEDESRDAAAEAELQRQAEAQQAAAAQEQQEAAQRRAEAIGSFFSGLWFWIKIALLGGVALWLWSQRDAILEWYYSLFPHPAQGMVDNAIYHGSPIDGDLYAEINAPAFGSRAESAVRTRQADELTRRLREHERVLREAEERELQRERARVERENAFVRAHAELLRAGIDHEMAAASLDQLRKATRRDDF